MAAWGTQYIKDVSLGLRSPRPLPCSTVTMKQHIASGKQNNKPIVMEEFGVEGYGNKTFIYPQWFQAALDGDIAGIMPWQ